MINDSYGQILPDSIKNRVGNTAHLLFQRDEHLAHKTQNQVQALPVDQQLERGSPFMWNGFVYERADPQLNGLDNNFTAFMDQTRMSTYFQDHPWATLQHAQRTGYQGPQLGGQIRGWVPPGYMPGNKLNKHMYA